MRNDERIPPPGPSLPDTATPSQTLRFALPSGEVAALVTPSPQAVVDVMVS
jgi:hypothetical protein